jgi:5-methylcytosine-specific restriction endonuclease McrA
MSLRTLSDVALLNRINRLTRSERSFTLRVLDCLIEVEWRKLHFAFGYSSMFNFCTSGLGYSGSAAGRRIQAARAIARFPEIRALLFANDVNVCTVSRVARILTPDNKDEILARIRRKSLDEVIAIVAEYRPPDAPVRDQVRNVMVSPPTRPLLDSMPWRQAGAFGAGANGTTGVGGADGGAAAGGANGAADDSSADVWAAGRGAAADGEAPAGDASDARASSAGDLEHRIILRFGVSADFMEKVERIRALTWHRLPANASLEQVFEMAIDDMLKRTDPLQRRAQRARRESARAEKATSTPPPAKEPTGRPVQEPAREPAREPAHEPTHEPTQKPVRKPVPEATVQAETPSARQIPARVRDEVYARDDGRCTFVGPDGRRCAATRSLQIDHVIPVARGGSGDIDNLRLMCAQHNRLLAERLFGARPTQGTRAPRPEHPARE